MHTLKLLGSVHSCSTRKRPHLRRLPTPRRGLSPLPPAAHSMVELVSGTAPAGVYGAQTNQEATLGINHHFRTSPESVMRESSFHRCNPRTQEAASAPQRTALYALRPTEITRNGETEDTSQRTHFSTKCYSTQKSNDEANFHLREKLWPPVRFHSEPGARWEQGRNPGQRVPCSPTECVPGVTSQVHSSELRVYYKFLFGLVALTGPRVEGMILEGKRPRPGMGRAIGTGLSLPWAGCAFQGLQFRRSHKPGIQTSTHVRLHILKSVFYTNGDRFCPVLFHV